MSSAVAGGRAGGGAPAAGKSHKRSRAERDAILAASRDATDEALESAVFGLGATAATAPGQPKKKAPKPQRGGGAVKAAWADDDDDGVAVNVAAVARLRKLRQTPEEETLSGGQYGERLRDQFARTAAAGGGDGVPEWAQLQSARARRKRAADSDDEEGSDDEDASDDGGVGGRPAASGSGSGSDDDEEEDDDDDEAAFRSAAGLTQASVALPPGKLNIARVRDANRAEPSKAVIQAVGWHPSGAVLFTAGLDKTLRFFAVDGRRNPKVASVYFPELPIASAAWSGDGSEVLVAGRRSWFYAYSVETGAATRVSRLLGSEEKSLESLVASPGGAAGAPGGSESPTLAFLGNNGAVVLASGRTKQRVATLKMNGSVRAAAFTRDPTAAPGGAWDQLLTVGGHGEVYRWDLRTMACMGRHVDEGSTGSTALAVTPDGSRYAVGSKSGVVNVYDAADALVGAAAAARGGDLTLARAGSAAAAGSVRGLFASAHAPAPLHRLTNLTTPVTRLAYNGGGSVLAMASDSVRDALKMVHAPTGTVFSNWPTLKTPLHYVSDVAFSPGSGFVTVGNDRGRVLLYRLNHFDSA